MGARESRGWVRARGSLPSAVYYGYERLEGGSRNLSRCLVALGPYAGMVDPRPDGPITGAAPSGKRAAWPGLLITPP